MLGDFLSPQEKKSLNDKLRIKENPSSAKSEVVEGSTKTMWDS